MSAGPPITPGQGGEVRLTAFHGRVVVAAPFSPFSRRAGKKSSKVSPALTGFLRGLATEMSQAFLPFAGTCTRSALPPITLASAINRTEAPFTAGAPGSLTILLVIVSGSSVARTDSAVAADQPSPENEDERIARLHRLAQLSDDAGVPRIGALFGNDAQRLAAGHLRIVQCARLGAVAIEGRRVRIVECARRIILRRQ